MARREAEAFSDPIYLVLVAGNRSEADRAESVLTARGVDYTLALEAFRNDSVLGMVFGGMYTGLFFYVPGRFHHLATQVLMEAGFRDIVPLQQEERE